MSRSVETKDFIVTINIRTERVSDIATGKSFSETQVHEIKDVYTYIQLQELLDQLEPVSEA